MQVLRLQEELKQSVSSQQNLETELQKMRTSTDESALRERQLAEQRLGALSSDTRAALRVEKEKAVRLESENAHLNQEKADVERSASLYCSLKIEDPQKAACVLHRQYKWPLKRC